MRPSRSVLIPAIVFCFASSCASAENRPRLRPLLNQQHVDGAGCSYQLTDSSDPDDVFQWDFADEAWINIGGSDIRLKFLSERGTSVRDDASSVGETHGLQFSAKDLRVFVRTKTTDVCEPDDEGCEAWSEEGVIEVVAGRRSWTTRIEGLCGS